MSESEQKAPAGSAAMAQILPAVAWVQSMPLPVVFTPPTTEEKEREVRILTIRNEKLKEEQQALGKKVEEFQKNYAQSVQDRDAALARYFSQHLRADLDSELSCNNVIAAAASIDINTDDLDRARAQFQTARLATREARRALEEAQIARNANRTSSAQERLLNQARANQLSVEIAHAHVRQGRGTEADYRAISYPIRSPQQFRRPKY